MKKEYNNIHDYLEKYVGRICRQACDYDVTMPLVEKKPRYPHRNLSSDVHHHP